MKIFVTDLSLSDLMLGAERRTFLPWQSVPDHWATYIQ